MLVNVSSWKGPQCDPTTRFDAGVHPFIGQESYAIYNYGEVERVVTIVAGLNIGRFLPKEPFPEPALTQIEAGILTSRFTPRKVKKYVTEQS